jgi:hypothetical protein
MDHSSIAGFGLSSSIPVFLGPDRTAVRLMTAELCDPHMPRSETSGGVSKTTKETENRSLIGASSTWIGFPGLSRDSAKKDPGKGDLSCSCEL